MHLNHEPKRTYYFSDAFGGHTQWNPLSASDLDVKMATDFRGRPAQATHIEQCIWGVTNIVHHYLRHLVSLQDELVRRKDLSEKKKQEALSLGTGVFINSAPRNKKGVNGEPFYLATLFGGSMRIVVTPLELLSSIKERIESLQMLPNPGPNDPSNGLYDHREQFRSSRTPILLDPNHEIDLVDSPIEEIPDYRKDWHAAFVDRYGNVVTHSHNIDKQWEIILAASQRVQRVQLSYETPKGNRTSPELAIATSLGNGEPGAVLIYKNGENIDIARKFQLGEHADKMLSQSAFAKMPGIEIGSSLSLSHT